MDERIAFLTRVRRERERRGITLQQLSDRTNVSVALWAAFEDNDFTRWPTGVFARAFVREYAAAIGLDPEETVDEFCRWFPQGDRRAERMLRAQAELIGLESRWRDEWDRRQAPKDRRRSGLHGVAGGNDEHTIRRRRRLVAAGLDVAAVIAVATPLAVVLRTPAWATVAVVALAYHFGMTVAFGASAGHLFVDRYLDRLAALLPIRRRTVPA